MNMQFTNEMVYTTFEGKLLSYTIYNNKLVYLTDKEFAVVDIGIKPKKQFFNLKGHNVVKFQVGPTGNVAIIYVNFVLEIRRISKITQPIYQFREVMYDVNRNLPLLRWVKQQIYTVYDDKIQIFDIVNKKSGGFADILQSEQNQRIIDILTSQLMQAEQIVALRLINKLIFTIIPLQVAEMNVQNLNHAINLVHSKSFPKIKRQYMILVTHNRFVKVYNFINLQQIAEVDFKTKSNQSIQIQKDPYSQFLLITILSEKKEYGVPKIKIQKNYLMCVNKQQFYMKKEEDQKPGANFFLYTVQLQLKVKISLLTSHRQIIQKQFYNSVDICYIKENSVILVSKLIKDNPKSNEKQFGQYHKQKQWEQVRQWKQIITSYMEMSTDYIIDFNRRLGLEPQPKAQIKQRQQYQFIKKNFDQVVKKFYKHLQKTKSGSFQTEEQEQQFMYDEWGRFFPMYLKDNNFMLSPLSFAKFEVQKGANSLTRVKSRQNLKQQKQIERQKKMRQYDQIQQKRAQKRKLMQEQKKRIQQEMQRQKQKLRIKQEEKIKKFQQQKQKVVKQIFQNRFQAQYQKFVSQFMSQINQRQTQFKIQKQTDKPKPKQLTQSKQDSIIIQKTNQVQLQKSLVDSIIKLSDAMVDSLIKSDDDSQKQQNLNIKQKEILSIKKQEKLAIIKETKIQSSLKQQIKQSQNQKLRKKKKNKKKKEKSQKVLKVTEQHKIELKLQNTNKMQSMQQEIIQIKKQVSSKKDRQKSKSILQPSFIQQKNYQQKTIKSFSFSQKGTYQLNDKNPKNKKKKQYVQKYKQESTQNFTQNSSEKAQLKNKKIIQNKIEEVQELVDEFQKQKAQEERRKLQLQELKKKQQQKIQQQRIQKIRQEEQNNKKFLFDFIIEQTNQIFAPLSQKVNKICQSISRIEEQHTYKIRQIQHKIQKESHTHIIKSVQSYCQEMLIQVTNKFNQGINAFNNKISSLQEKSEKNRQIVLQKYKKFVNYQIKNRIQVFDKNRNNVQNCLNLLKNEIDVQQQNQKNNQFFNTFKDKYWFNEEQIKRLQNKFYADKNLQLPQDQNQW